MARLDELEFDNESEEERSVEERVKAQGGSSAATPSAAAAAGKGGNGDGDDGGVGSDKDEEDGEGSVVDPRRPAGGAEGDKPKKRRPRFTEDHIIGANGACKAVRAFLTVCLCLPYAGA